MKNSEMYAFIVVPRKKKWANLANEAKNTIWTRFFLNWWYQNTFISISFSHSIETLFWNCNQLDIEYSNSRTDRNFPANSPITSEAPMNSNQNSFLTSVKLVIFPLKPSTEWKENCCLYPLVKFPFRFHPFGGILPFIFE